MSSNKPAFLAKLKDMRLTQFSFSNFEIRVRSQPEADGTVGRYLVFTLDEAIERVKSSTVIYQEDQRTNRVKTDVTEIRCNLDLIEKYADDWEFDEDGDNLKKTGKYRGDMFFDLSSKEEVWLTDTKFSRFKLDQRKKENKAMFERFFKLNNAEAVSDPI